MNRIAVWRTLCFYTFHAKREPQAKRFESLQYKNKANPIGSGGEHEQRECDCVRCKRHTHIASNTIIGLVET